MNENQVVQKSYAFALKIVENCSVVMKDRSAFVLARQLLKSGTSVGVNVAEAQGGQSLKDFISKLSIAYKEAKESHYWIRLLRDSGFLEQKIAVSMLHDCDELLKLLGSIIKTCKTKIRK